MSKVYEYKGEKFVLEDSEQCSLIVKDDENAVTISVASGNFSVRRADGWGYWETDLNKAVNAACRLLMESREQKTNEERCEELHEFVKAL